jgi:hypothetical protein
MERGAGGAQREAAPLNSETKGSRSHPRFFDDPTLRVRLADGFREELRREKQAGIAASVHSPRANGSSERLDPSSVSRYAAGKVAPTLRVARQMAQALGKPLMEAVAGFAPRHARPTPSWAELLLTSRTYRAQAVELIGMFSHVLRLVHLGVITDAERQHRAVVRPAEDVTGYRYFEIVLAEPITARTAADFMLSYLLFETPSVFVDYGRVTLRRAEIHGAELWTTRAYRQKLRVPVQRVWVQTWLDGKATDFVVRSNQPFTVGPMVTRRELPRPRVVVPFRPCGIHQNAERAR